MGNDAFYHFLFDAFTNTASVMANDASIYVFHADTEGLNFRKAFCGCRFLFIRLLHLEEAVAGAGALSYQWQHEPVLYGGRKTGKHQWYTGRKETTIWEFDKPKKKAITRPPEAGSALGYPIMNSSMSNTLVLDPFGGSGSTLSPANSLTAPVIPSSSMKSSAMLSLSVTSKQVGTADKVSVQRRVALLLGGG